MLTRARSGQAARGFNLIEAAIVLGVIGLVIGGIWIAAAAVQRAHRQTIISKETGQLIEGLKEDFGRGPLAAGTGFDDITSYITARNYAPTQLVVNSAIRYQASSGDPGRIQLGIHTRTTSASDCMALVDTIVKSFRSCFGSMFIPNGSLAGDKVAVNSSDTTDVYGVCSKSACPHLTTDYGFYLFYVYFVP